MSGPRPAFHSLLEHQGDQPLNQSLIDPQQDVPAEHRPAGNARPWVFTNMVTSLDGATALDGVSGQLGGVADKEMFRALRSSTDAIIVGAKTATAERYRQPRPNHLNQIPLLVVVSGSLSVPLDLPVLTSPSYRPVIATSERGKNDGNEERLNAVADVQTFGDDTVDLHSLLRRLRQQGIQRVLLEGGPTLNGQFVAQGLVDEWNLTLSPQLVGGTSTRTSYGAACNQASRPLNLRRLWVSDNTLFGRWTR